MYKLYIIVTLLCTTTFGTIAQTLTTHDALGRLTLQEGEQYIMAWTYDAVGNVIDYSVQPVAPLPVELVSFEANLQEGEGVELKWVTATEVNSDYFVVERSLNGVDFQPISEPVPAQGNSDEKTNYQSWDREILGIPTDIIYYRLKQVDIDGSFQYSRIKAVHLPTQDAVQGVVVYPNPTSGKISFKGITSEGEVILFDATGRRAISPRKTKGFSLEIGNLPRGLYVGRLKTDDGKLYRFKVVLE